MTQPPLITHVSDTARWVAVYRAQESERPDRLFDDPFARRLAGPRGEAIVRGLPRGAQMAWPMVVRTAVMDEVILRVIARDGITTVLNLAAGLDARPWRLQLPASLQWIDVDHPEMIEYKRAAMAAEPTFALWLTDLASPGLLKMMARSWGPVLEAWKAPFRFGPSESTGFFAPYGWREVEWRSQMVEGPRLKRTFPMARIWNFLGRFAPKHRREEFRRFSGIALMERLPPAGLS